MKSYDMEGVTVLATSDAYDNSPRVDVLLAHPDDAEGTPPVYLSLSPDEARDHARDVASAADEADPGNGPTVTNPKSPYEFDSMVFHIPLPLQGAEETHAALLARQAQLDALAGTGWTLGATRVITGGETLTFLDSFSRLTPDQIGWH